MRSSANTARTAVSPKLLFRALVAAVIAALLAACGQGDSSALITSAKSYLDKGDERSAIIQLRSALQKQPDQAEARFLLGRTLLDRDNPV